MELKEVLLNRRSIRKFTEEKVSEEAVQALLEAAMSGPSACNCRTWEFYVIEKGEILAELKDVSPFSKIEAPLAIVVCGNLSHALPLKLSEFWVQDCSAATENILLQATDLGLGAVWCGIYPDKARAKKLAKLLEMPGNQIPLNIIYIGHPAQEQPARTQYDEKYVHRVR